MKKLLIGASAAAALLTAGAAQAVTIQVGPQTDYATDFAARELIGDIVWDFDTYMEDGFAFEWLPPGGLTGVIPNGESQDQDFRAPLGDTTNYGAVRGFDEAGEPEAAGIFTSDKRMNYFSFLLGSADYYNNIAFYNGDVLVAAFSNADGIFSNGQTGGANIAQRVTFSFGLDEDVNKVIFTSKYDAMEFDTIAVNTAVPEPATWGMMLMGFFGLGGLLRSRRERQALA